MKFVVLSSVLCGLLFSNGFAYFAPDNGPMVMMENRCTIGNLRPGTQGNTLPTFPEPSGSSNPDYSLTASVFGNKYKPGSTVSVTLSAPGASTFTGFFITIDPEQGKPGMVSSSYTSTLGNQIQYCMQPGLTQKDQTPKNSVQFNWNFDSRNNYTLGNIQFKATVVNGNKYYTGIVSNIIQADPTIDNFKAFKDKQFKQMSSGNFGPLMQSMLKRFSNAKNTNGGGGGGGFPPFPPMNGGNPPPPMPNFFGGGNQQMPNFAAMPGMQG